MANKPLKKHLFGVGKKPLPASPYQGRRKSSRTLLPVLGLLAGVAGGFGLLVESPLPAWVFFALAALLLLVAWWQTGCVKADLPVGACHAGDSPKVAESEESPAWQAPTCGWKYWLVRVGVFLSTAVLGFGGLVGWWWVQDDKPLWRLGFVPLPEMVRIPAGEFQMGGENSAWAQPVHTVTIKQPFYISKYEITFAEYDYYRWLMARNAIEFDAPDDAGWGRDTRPVINVSWDDAQGYVNWLSKETGASCRLPTEAEWEYAARAGTTTDYPWGDEASHDYANYGKDECCDGLAEGKDQWVNTAPVGSFPSNPFGLHDMRGNVYEWVQDCWHEDYQGAPADGTAWESGGDCGRRVLRGGSWNLDPYYLRSSNRFYFAPDHRDDNLGFRVVCVLPLTGR
ncbi:MAG: SUMF1/EgtB/PvdO family nonheme iron enzyme [Gammaproteobacteria bacterium]|nr:SUMF1/EgtB/PvdO family nonheme iron enzyme [Gammaproteobacteria bacterium]MBU1723278.1 SUMF1/EgtB/PvdO family nonheme iron enzyme [Gammaproteobacteria bacterium]MBU2006573.1 SUMF1/EgtB/PvdO family nonheme iron enzyme [Gammaproteobacteria bacterium]